MNNKYYKEICKCGHIGRRACIEEMILISGGFSKKERYVSGLNAKFNRNHKHRISSSNHDKNLKSKSNSNKRNAMKIYRQKKAEISNVEYRKYCIFIDETDNEITL